ncbi:hypothetical protein RhiirA5_407470 [Rhizophagus irregularis]|uniref:Uncharacterized protein n=1 Tax=Rhizophagus irregularis TaxID=588596 RepID=A0A2I1E039_9GLOM|nr:hypothetical protein RhiirA5_407470 [Rhizophagus irregularis]PKC74351.1 hypothetical protein RhiirA1_388211 [Rhizophagus irregularis]PKY15488.1 hypothetical protein RhiirB3_380975 [Rhizophagus irregularis]CAB5199985.1 unnamed protein product [Rhizophagus irregularis]CAB5391714.1 unnamed protein product [Rhizophagus irregularis]
MKIPDEDEQFVKKIIRDVSDSLQKIEGWSLYNQHWTNSKNLEVSQETNAISIGEMDYTLRDTVSSISSCDKCDVKVQVTDNSSQQDQKNFTESSTETQEYYPVNRELSSSGTLKAKLASFIFNRNPVRITTWQKLPEDFERQYSQDIFSLLDIVKSICPFNETSGDVLDDCEIDDFLKTYGISNVHPILESDDNYVFWLEDTAGVVYVWSRISYNMFYIGHDLREALVNFLFHQDKICYIMEYTHEHIPKDKFKQEAYEYAKSIKPIKWVETNEPLKLKRDGKGKEKKKGKKKGKKKKNKH